MKIEKLKYFANDTNVKSFRFAVISALRIHQTCMEIQTMIYSNEMHLSPWKSIFGLCIKAIDIW